MPPRGKFKPSRGGGKHFSRDVQLRDKDGNPMTLFGEHDGPENNEEEKSSSEEQGSGSGSDSGSEEEGEEGKEAGPSMTREERRAAAKAKKQAAIARRKQMATQPGDLPPSDDENDAGEGPSEDGAGGDLPANPNHTAKSREQLEKPDESSSKPKKDLSQLSRREREALEAQQERERYMKLHAEGKTDEAKSDLARLAVIREQREAERGRKQLEKEEKEAAAKEKAAAREALLNKKGPKKGGKKK